MNRPSIPAQLRREVFADGGTRCGYCQSDESLTGAPLCIDHILPIAAGGSTTRENLWLACRSCNEFKGALTRADDPDTGESAPIFNPRTQDWKQHFRWSEDGVLVIGTTPTGRATVVALHLNRTILQRARHRWVQAGWHPPQ